MKRLLTTPIYYVNDVPHIGHAYTTIIADVLKKYWMLKGEEVFLLTGTDEHGQKIEQAAKKKGLDINSYVDSISSRFKATWDSFQIDYDKFMRTTFLEHRLSVKQAFDTMFDRGDIYKGEYEGRYCVSCESFFTQIQVVDEIYCPDCGKSTQIVKEESYFFALSKYQENLLKWYKEDENCILPLHKKNEVISFVSQGLQDLSITRTSFDWGIKIPDRLGDPKHIIYVWLDALMNYISALGYALLRSDNLNRLKSVESENPTLVSKLEYFNHATHVVGKDILRFHAVYWPAFLLSLDLPLPKQILVHGWWTIDGVKMSKSLGNVVDPMEIKDLYKLDTLRYFLLKEVPFGQDGDFSCKALINRNNGELSNDLGNLLNRLQGMAEKYFNSNLENSLNETSYMDEKNKISSNLKACIDYMDSMQPHKYLESIWELIHIANELITKIEPWKLMKEGRDVECKEFLNLIANILAKSALLLYPVIPEASKKIAYCLGVSIESKNFEKFIQNNFYAKSFSLKSVDPLFPKIEAPLDITTPKNAPNTPAEKPQSLVSIQDFKKLTIIVGTIKEAARLEWSDKLFKLQVDVGEPTCRQIVSGLGTDYEASSLVGRQVCVLANLKPVKFRGEVSEGMILTAKDSALSLLSPDMHMKNGSEIC